MQKQNNMCDNVWIRDPPYGMETVYKEMFSKEAITFLELIISEFDDRLENLILQRQKRNLEITEKTWQPKFENEHQHLNWKVDEIPIRLQNRKIDLGDVSPANTIQFVDALYSDAQGIQVDFDDGHCPTWRNTIRGHNNIHLAINSLLSGAPNDITQCPTLMFRPRAFNMIEHNCIINGKEINGALFDFAILMFFNGKKLSDLEIGPYFYLSKIESADETKLWNDIFLFAQVKLNIPRGTIKACVLIENILAAYSMDEILYNFREHAIGLNCGIWDYCASIIAKFGDDKNMIFPDRTNYINITKPFLYKYMNLVINICHRRGAFATSGMAAQVIPSKTDQPKLYNEIIEKVKSSKTTEILKGFDGFLIFDFRLIPELEPIWNELCPDMNQMKRKPDIMNITSQCLIDIPKHEITLSGLQNNIHIVLLFIYHWLTGTGIFFKNNTVEDSATAEISRLQLWQWIRHGVQLDTGEFLTTSFLLKQLETIVQHYLGNLCKTTADRKRLLSSKYLLIEIITSKSFIEYLTTFLNDNHKFRSLHNKSDTFNSKL